MSEFKEALKYCTCVNAVQPKNLTQTIHKALRIAHALTQDVSNSCVEVCINEVNRDVKNKVNRSNVRNGLKAFTQQLIKECEDE